MLDIAVLYDKYKFLGNEFLTWLWYLIEIEAPITELAGMKDGSVVLQIGNSIVLENSLGDKSKEKITIKGDDAGLEEGATALKKGAVVTEINLILNINENEFRLTLKGESMNVTGLKVPATSPIEGENEIEGAVLEKQYLCSIVFNVIDSLFISFIKKRLSENWKNRDLPEIRRWIHPSAS